MTKQDLVDMVAKQVGLTKADAGRAVEAILDSITNALGKGQDVMITGFGKFDVRTRKARMGRNLQTGEPLHIPSGKNVHFTVGKNLKEAVK